MALPQIDVLLHGFGADYNNGKAYGYYAGTTTLLTWYTDANATIPAANPVTLDSTGKATVYCAERLRLDVKNAAGVSAPGFPVDNIGFSGYQRDAWVDVASFGGDKSLATINAALTSVGSTVTTLYFEPGTWAITNNLTIPSTLNVVVDNGTHFDITTAKTLTINGAFACGLFAVFQGTGAVAFGVGAVSSVPVEWFGATTGDPANDSTAAIHRAIAAARLAKVPADFVGGKYYCNVVVSDYSVFLRGTAVDTTTSTQGATLAPYNVNLPVLTVGNDSKILYGFKMQDIHINSYSNLALTNSGKIGLKLGGGAYQCNISNLSVNGAFSEYGILVQPGVTYPTAYIDIDGLRMQQDSGSSMLALIAFLIDGTGSWGSTLSLSNFAISGPGGSGATGATLLLDGADITITNGHMQCANNNGIKLINTAGVYPHRLFANNVIVDSDSGTDVLVETYRTISPVPIVGEMAVNGYIEYSDASTFDLTGIILNAYTPLIYAPTVQAELYFSSAASIPDATNYIRRNSTALEVTSTTGQVKLIGSTGISINSIAAGTATNNTIYVDSGDGKLYFKDAGGVARALY